MPDTKNLKYFVLPNAEVVQFNNKLNVQRLTGDVNAIRPQNEKVQGNGLLYVQNIFRHKRREKRNIF